MSEARLSFRAHEGPADHRASKMGADRHENYEILLVEERSYSSNWHSRPRVSEPTAEYMELCLPSLPTRPRYGDGVNEIVWERTKITPLSIRAHTLVAVSF